MDASALSYPELRALQRKLESESQRRLHCWAANPTTLTPEVKSWDEKNLTELCCDLYQVKSHRGRHDRKTHRAADALLDILSRELTRRRLMDQLDGLQSQAALSIRAAATA